MRSSIFGFLTVGSGVLLICNVSVVLYSTIRLVCRVCIVSFYVVRYVFCDGVGYVCFVEFVC